MKGLVFTFPIISSHELAAGHRVNKIAIQWTCKELFLCMTLHGAINIK